MPAGAHSTASDLPRWTTAALEALYDVGHRGLVRHVDPLSVSRDVKLVGDRLRCVIDRVEQVEEGHAHALGREGSGEGQADAASTAGDDSSTAAEGAGHGVSLFVGGAE